MLKNCFTKYIATIKDIELPKKFTFPFYYEPHPLCKIAAAELQVQLGKSDSWEHNFGLNSKDGIGKMFGVLVVKNKQNEIGYLTAFSGKLNGKNKSINFVPPVFDIFSENGFFQKEEQLITEISQEIINLENDSVLSELITCHKKLEFEKNTVLSEERKKLKFRRKERREKRVEKMASEKLIQESLHDKFYYRELSIYWMDKLKKVTHDLEKLTDSINGFKKERKERSEKLHQQIFEQYHFLNPKKNGKSLLSIFQEISKKPIAGTGNCAAPKLLQYAFQNDLQPIAMAEFWFGEPLKNEVRKHLNYYPACNGKCKPILNYMLKGIEMDENPILINLAKNKEIETLFEDEYFVVINKPNELLSVPGKNIEDSVYTRMQQKYPYATGPLIVHRLDMSTSGIMLIAKSKNIHKKLQSQFIKRTIKKKYVALLDGILSSKKGTVNLPLSVNLENTPKQMVCFEHGKNAKTNFEIIEIKNNKTRIHFYPITGRTHQLRVHAAHYLGLNLPIVGDDLYGEKSDRLYLHAASLTFVHPITKKEIQINSKAPF